MKNAINYYYNLILDDIHQTDKFYYFNYDNLRYVLISYDGDIAALNDIYNLHLNLLNNGLYVHQIVLNRDNQIVTLINSIPYVLLKTKYYDGTVNYEMVLSFLNTPVDKNLNIILPNRRLGEGDRRENKNSLFERVSWGNLWANKNDYLEYQISQLGQKHEELRDSFSYYIGLGETATQLVNSLSMDGIKVIAHKRINSDDTFFDLYNPLNLIVDSRTRDMAEYFKTSFFSGKDISAELNHFLKVSNLSENEHLLFLARMLYPTYYFDLFEDIISGKIEDKEIKKITDLSSDYEILLKKLYRYYKSLFNIQPIEWLDKY